MEKERKVAIVAGGASTVGKAIALQLAKDGFAVCILDTDEENGERAAKSIDAITAAKFISYDIANSPVEAPKAMEEAYKAFGRIDVLVNAAEVLGRCQAEKITSEAFDNVININAKGTLFTAIAASAYMKKNETGGNILNISSILGRIAIGEHALFSASKGAVISMTRELAVDLAPYKIKVNSLAVWAVDTPEMSVELDASGMRERILSTMLLDRMITPEDVSELVSFLVSDDSFSIHGFDLALDGGMPIFRAKPQYSYFTPEGKNYAN